MDPLHQQLKLKILRHLQDKMASLSLRPLNPPSDEPAQPAPHIDDDEFKKFQAGAGRTFKE